MRMLVGPEVIETKNDMLNHHGLTNLGELNSLVKVTVLQVTRTRVVEEKKLRYIYTWYPVRL